MNIHGPGLVSVLTGSAMLLALTMAQPAEKPASAEAPKGTARPRYDAALAKRLGADELGMRNYVMCFLKTGPLQVDDLQKRADLMKGHFGMIQRLAAEKKLVLAGPFKDGGELRGIYLFDVPSIEDARKLTESDPSIREGFFKVEFVKWYGSAALLEVNDIHARIAQKSP